MLSSPLRAVYPTLLDLSGNETRHWWRTHKQAFIEELRSKAQQNPVSSYTNVSPPQEDNNDDAPYYYLYAIWVFGKPEERDRIYVGSKCKSPGPFSDGYFGSPSAEKTYHATHDLLKFVLCVRVGNRNEEWVRFMEVEMLKGLAAVDDPRFLNHCDALALSEEAKRKGGKNGRFGKGRGTIVVEAICRRCDGKRRALVVKVGGKKHRLHCGTCKSHHRQWLITTSETQPRNLVEVTLETKSCSLFILER